MSFRWCAAEAIGGAPVHLSRGRRVGNIALAGDGTLEIKFQDGPADVEITLPGAPTPGAFIKLNKSLWSGTRVSARE
jgi:hypothetical protein